MSLNVALRALQAAATSPKAKKGYGRLLDGAVSPESVRALGESFLNLAEAGEVDESECDALLTVIERLPAGGMSQ